MQQITPFRYRLHGTILSSEIQFPELNAVEPSANRQPEVALRFGPVPTSLDNSYKIAHWIEATRKACLFKVPRVCRILVSSGNEIVFESLADQDEGVTRDYIIGCGFPTITHQRKLLPLHVSMVESPTGIWAFAGISGAGKSTLATTLSQKMGWPLLCDDIAVLNQADDNDDIYFDLNKIKLWADALENLSFDNASVHNDSFRAGKFNILQKTRTSRPHSRITKLFQLEWSVGPTSIVRLSHAQAFTVLMNSIQGPYFVNIYGDLKRSQKLLLRIASHTTSFRVLRDKEDIDADQVINRLTELDC